MKLCKFGLFLALLVAACFPAAAQTQLYVNVPFDFVVAGQAMPAGQYRVTTAFETDNVAWTILGDHTSAVFLTNAVQSPNVAHPPSLIFLRQGGKLSLAQIWHSQHSGQDVLRKKIQQAVIAQGEKVVVVGAE
jgi:hypothetical protein